MSRGPTGNVTHDAELLRAEGVRQSAARAPGASQATVKAADIAYYRAALASAKTTGINPVCFITALLDLGTGGS